MGRRMNIGKKQALIQTVAENDGQIKAADIAKKLDLHPQEVTRILTALEDDQDTMLYEDDKGYLSIFSRKG